MKPAPSRNGDMLGSRNSFLLRSQYVSCAALAKNINGPYSKAGNEYLDTKSRNDGGKRRPIRCCKPASRAALSNLTIRQPLENSSSVHSGAFSRHNPGTS